MIAKKVLSPSKLNPPPPKKKAKKKASPKTKRTWTVSKKNEVKYLHWRSNLHFVENFFYPVYRLLDYFFFFLSRNLSLTLFSFRPKSLKKYCSVFFFNSFKKSKRHSEWVFKITQARERETTTLCTQAVCPVCTYTAEMSSNQEEGKGLERNY